MVQWTQNQKEAIYSRNSNLLLSAAAGSGKTAVLVERILQLILSDGRDIDRFLIVTFTNAAAGEMRERINRALHDAIEEGTWDEAHLRRQIQLLDRAHISTIHSFCLDVVRKYFHLIEIDPVFRIGDSTETTLLKLEALEELMEEEYAKEDQHFLELVEMYGGNRDDVGLQNLILQLYDFIQSKPQPKEWLEERIGDFAMDREAFENSHWYSSLCQQLNLDLNAALDLFRNALEIAQFAGGPEVYQPTLEDDIRQVEGLLDDLNRGFTAFHRGLKTIQFSRLRSAREVDEELKKACQDLRNGGKDIIKELGKRLLVKEPEEFIRELNEIHPHMETLGRLAMDLGDHYRSKKQEQGMVDFNDLEHYALSILEYPEAAEEYRERFDYIFVDEYQDSNLIQETIVNRIKSRDNVFLVGDVKQSIYRFRLADPTLFMEKYEHYKDDDSALDRRIHLSKNFRSRKEIIQGCNFIFSHLMSKEFGEIEYDEHAALYLGKDFEEIRDSQIQLDLIERNSPIQEDVLDGIHEIEDIELEAHWMAKRIKDLLNTQIYDEREGHYRNVEYRDVVVLLRTTKIWAQRLSEVFIAQGIPVYADVNSGYFDAIEVNILMNLLKVIDNKRQDIPLLSVLRSPVFQLSTQELIKIRAGSRKETYFEALEDYSRDHEDQLAEKLRSFLDRIGRWKEESRYIPMEDFLWKLLKESNYYYYVGAMPGGAQRQANIRVLLDRARQFQQTSMKGLFHFIKFVDQLKSSSGDMGAAKILGENDNVVRVMSIHKSKGLEFPIVILGGLGKQFNLQDTRQPVLFHKDLGLGPNYVNLESRSYNESIAKMAMKNRIKIENLSEEMRILYVALTRPKDRLIMVGLVKDLTKSIERWAQGIKPHHLAAGKSYMDWIGPILLRHRDGQILREMASLNWGAEHLIRDPSQWNIRCIPSRDILMDEVKRGEHGLNIRRILDQPREAPYSPLRDEIARRLDWSYGHRLSTLLPSKLSVTQIKRAGVHSVEALGVDIPTMTAKPAFMDGKSGLTGQERGILTHFVLQHLDLGRISSIQDIQDQIQGMVEKELIHEGEAHGVDIPGLMAFFSSPLGQRIRKADRVYREVPFNLVKRAEDVLPHLDGEEDPCREEILIQGVIDCYFEEGEDLVLVDYKTDYYHSEAMKQRIIQNYRSQIQLYREALEKIQGKRVKESYLYLFHQNEEVLI